MLTTLMWIGGYALFWFISRIIATFVMTLMGINKKDDDILHFMIWIPLIGELIMITAPMAIIAFVLVMTVRDYVIELAEKFQKNMKSRFSKERYEE